MSGNELSDANPRMQQAVEHFNDAMKRIRTGRASASILDAVSVEVYGQRTPLSHAATITTVDAQMLQITPFDPGNLTAISAAIRDDKSLGLNPADDGKVVRVPIPPLTEERRLEIVKQVGEKAEEAKITLRNIRHDILNSIKQEEKAGDASKDDVKDCENKLNKIIEEFNIKVDESAKLKEQEIMKV
ncbi:ribosome recycling factor [Candidatus Saccharibacteria bacterium]|nr:ribosome recycling factor [Candidatus Saccharibacteria bacterium]